MMDSEIIRLSNDIELNVYFHENDKPTLLLLHFGSGNLHMWSGLIPHLKHGYQIIAPDLRGHGNSSKPDNGYHIEDMAYDIELLLEKLNVDKYYIVGSSLGAEVATVLTANNPEKVQAIVCEGALYNEFGEYGLLEGDKEDIEDKIEEKLKEIEKRKDEHYQTKQEFIETRARFFQRAGLWNQYFEEYIKNNICKDEKGRYTSCYPTYVSKQYMRNYYYFQFEKYYKKIKCPILFLPSKSEWKNERIKESTKEFGKMAGSYEIQVIQGFTHAYGWMKMPGQAAQVVTKFLKKY